MGRRRLPFVPNAYPWIFSLSALAFLLWLGWNRAPAAGARGVSRIEVAQARFDAGTVALAGGLVGARLGYAAWHLAYFLAHPWDFLYFWQGGLDWFGGLIGAGLALAALSRAARHPVLPLADSLALRACFVVAAVAAIILILSPFRGDASLDLLGLRGDALGALLLLVSALGFARALSRVPTAT